MLTDAYNRTIDYLRVSVTDKCNLRCVYCMPEGLPLLSHDEVLRNEEFIYFIGLFADLGVKKVRFTGGEPLVRKGIIDIIARTHELYPRLELGLTTNGVLLGEHLDGLRRTAVKKLNISLDAISPARFEEITGRNALGEVLRNIEKALGYGFFSIKVNVVLFDRTIDELDDMLDYFRDKDIVLRFIERMPFTGAAGNPFLPSGTLISELRERGDLRRNDRGDTRVAEMFDFLYRGRYPMRIGSIPPMTHKFCRRCNRLRLTCDGFLKTCLHADQEYDLKTPYRMDMGADAIRDIITAAVREKPVSHTMECVSDERGICPAQKNRARRPMSKIGG